MITTGLGKGNDIELGIAQSWLEFQKIRTLVFNSYQLEVSGTTADASDTEFTYILHTGKKLKKSELAEIKIFIKGIQSCMRSF